jgi:hypothetical protein
VTSTHDGDACRTHESQRDEENQPKVVIPTRIRGNSSVVTAAVVDLNLGAGSRDHIAST